MKFLIFLALALAATSAFDLRSSKIEPNDIDKTAIKHEGRMTHAKTALVGQFNYQVGISTMLALSSIWCGGSLIDKNWILTAAHCTIDAESVTVYLGSTVRKTAEVMYTLFSEDIIIHAEYNRKNFNNDICLIRIPPVTYSNTIGVVKLPAIVNSYSTYIGDTVIASGWGHFSDSNPNASDSLQWAELQIIPNADCTDYYGASLVIPSTICVATPNRVSTCHGDSGGPLVLNSSKVLIGVTSFVPSVGCERGHPAAFIRVTSYLNWIKSNTDISY